MISTMREGLIRMTSTSLRTMLKGAYLRVFDRLSFRAHLDYLYTDEHLKFVHILEAINYTHIAELPAVYFEFGCHSGRTFSAAVRAARYLKMKDTHFFAFDSFQGLPETTHTEDGYFKSGTFATGVDEFVRSVRTLSGLSLKRTNIIEGFYEKSLSPDLQANMPKAGVIHIDVDLYSSTVEVLRFIKPLMMIGTVLIFDDWFCFPPGTNKGEARALKEFCLENPSFSVEEWKTYSTFGKSFFVTSLP
jgi:O-methyltransferase